MGIFNSMIAACAHGGEYAKARHMFDSMAEHGCEPDAVTYANLIRAFKKGGQWCAASRSIFRRFILSFSPRILEWGGHCSKHMASKELEDGSEQAPLCVLEGQKVESQLHNGTEDTYGAANSHSAPGRSSKGVHHAP